MSFHSWDSRSIRSRGAVAGHMKPIARVIRGISLHDAIGVAVVGGALGCFLGTRGETDLWLWLVNAGGGLITGAGLGAIVGGIFKGFGGVIFGLAGGVLLGASTGDFRWLIPAALAGPIVGALAGPLVGTISRAIEGVIQDYFYKKP